MNTTEAGRLFDEANRLWFREARYNQVLPLYREALKHDSTDPVILYQLATALWAFEQFDEARELISIAEQHQDRLSESGKLIFTYQKEDILASVPFRCSFPIPAEEIDLDKLELMKRKDWLDISYAAEERRMFKLAEYAFDKGVGISDGDAARELRELLVNNNKFFHNLTWMRPEMKE